jgi:tRNA(Met) cytidine acetyltransferase
MERAHRRCIVLRGDKAATLERARAIVGDVEVLWPGDDVHAALGSAADAVVVSLHDGLSADDLGAAAGLVRGGGWLVVCAPYAMAAHPALVVHPYAPSDVGDRFWRRVLARLERISAHVGADVAGQPDCGTHDAEQQDAGPHDVGPHVVDRAPAPAGPFGSGDQADAVARLVHRCRSAAPTRTALLADRGRGKSSALGLAVRELVASGARVVVTAARKDAAAEVFRFAGADVAFVEPAVAARALLDADVIVVDEGAQLPVPLLRAMLSRNERAHFAFATTTHGYEGTGHGFVVRFLAALADVEVLRLATPVRWASGDPVEAVVNDALLLDVDIDDDVAVPACLPDPVVLDRAALASDERLLRSLFGLLVHAHYRTTPGDLHRLLDAPNLAVHAVVVGGAVLGATLVAREGGLPLPLCEDLARGRGRIRGHALADTLVTHAGRPDAGTLSMIRSVRIAVHPAARRRHVARALVEHVHATYAPDLFGTVFGATTDLLRFRRAVGYEVVRVGVARGTRSGEPSAVMLRAATPRAHALVDALRADVARDLPLQLRLLRADVAGVDDDLAVAFAAGLPAAAPLSSAEITERVRRYLDGPQPFEAAAWALTRFCDGAAADGLSERERALVRGRVQEARSWDDVAASAGYPSTSAAMRALRPAIARLFAAATTTPR